MDGIVTDEPVAIVALQSPAFADPHHSLSTEIFVDIDGDKYLANISECYPDASLSAPTSSSRKVAKTEPGTSASQSPPPIPHSLGCDLSIPTEKAMSKDDPSEYEYQVQLISQKEVDASAGLSVGDDGAERWGQKFVRVPADQLQ